MDTLTGLMPTDRPERYAKQLLSHWSERGTQSEEGGASRLDWHDGQVLVLTPREGSLEIEVGVPDGEDVVRFAEVVARHLERFGQRDELVVTWEPAGG
jgi:hypothetical protein